MTLKSKTTIVLLTTIILLGAIGCSPIERKLLFYPTHHPHDNSLTPLIRNNEVIGYASLSRWSERAAYNGTAEISIYISHKHHNKGIGKKLMLSIIEAGKQAGLHCVLSRISQGNDKSIYLHQQYGFNTVGVMKEVGNKFGKLLDVTIMQLMYQ